MSSIEFEKFRRNWSKKNSAQRFPMGRVNSASRFYWRSTGREPVHYEICERFAPIFLRRTHVSLLEIYKELLLMPLIF
ncbi:hypothetical protein LEP1GSC021_1985 [Leptospira noguchii str. 1993005606]|nr:hypothetical protein LEP1GSC021_1985 [Leptospira noguchii str. 1993005606]